MNGVEKLPLAGEDGIMAAAWSSPTQSPQNHVRSLGSVVNQPHRARVDGTGPPCTTVSISKFSSHTSYVAINVCPVLLVSRRLKA